MRAAAGMGSNQRRHCMTVSHLYNAVSLTYGLFVLDMVDTGLTGSTLRLLLLPP